MKAFRRLESKKNIIETPYLFVLRELIKNTHLQYPHFDPLTPNFATQILEKSQGSFRAPLKAGSMGVV